MYTHLQHPHAPPTPSTLELSRAAARSYALTEHLRRPRQHRLDRARLRLARWIAPPPRVDLGPVRELRA